MTKTFADYTILEQLGGHVKNVGRTAGSIIPKRIIRVTSICEVFGKRRETMVNL